MLPHETEQVLAIMIEWLRIAGQVLLAALLVGLIEGAILIGSQFLYRFLKR